MRRSSSSACWESDRVVHQKGLIFMAQAAEPPAANELHQQLTPPDEYFHHQTTGFFGQVADSDLNWRERCWIPIQTKDGKTVICIGLGNFPNRNVQDAFVIVSH